MSSNPIVSCGVNGDPLHKGKLDLPELLEVPTREDWTWASGFQAAVGRCLGCCAGEVNPSDIVAAGGGEAGGQKNSSIRARAALAC